METPIWPFTENQFVNATEGSYKKMNIVSADTDSKLYGAQANPAIQLLYAYLNPHRYGYLLKYVAWKSKMAAYHGKTATVYQLLADLSSIKIEEFDVKIQVVYRRGTEGYIKLMPNFRAPFQTGEIDERITALATLIESIGADPALAAVKADIVVFYNLINGARNEHQALEGQGNTLSAELELERVNCGNAMYYVLGGLMQVFSTNPSQIADFFDLETLRGHVADVIDLIFAGPVGSGQVINVLNPLVSQYIPGVTLRIKNTSTDPGVGQLFFYTAMTPTDGWTGIGQALSPGQEMTITISAAEFRAYFNVQNQSPNPQSFEVEIITS